MSKGSAGAKQAKMASLALLASAAAAVFFFNWEPARFRGASQTPADPAFHANNMEARHLRGKWMAPSAKRIRLEFSDPKTGALIEPAEEAKVMWPKEGEKGVFAIHARAKIALAPGEEPGGKSKMDGSGNGIEPAAIELQFFRGAVLKAIPIEGGARFEVPQESGKRGLWLYPVRAKVSEANVRIAVLKVGTVSESVFKRMASDDKKGPWFMLGKILSVIGAIASFAFLMEGLERRRKAKQESAPEKAPAP